MIPISNRELFRKYALTPSRVGWGGFGWLSTKTAPSADVRPLLAKNADRKATPKEHPSSYIDHVHGAPNR